jgi:uncharacterized protein (DUF4415 family)
MPDDTIDTSEMPAVADWTGAQRGRFYKPKKLQKTLRIDADVLAWFEAQGPGHLTRMNRALRAAMLMEIRRKKNAKAVGNEVDPAAEANIFAIIEEAVKEGKMVWVPGSNKQELQVLQDNCHPPTQPSPHFEAAIADGKTPAPDTASVNFSISGMSRCSGMFGISS